MIKISFQLIAFAFSVAVCLASCEDKNKELIDQPDQPELPEEPEEPEPEKPEEKWEICTDDSVYFKKVALLDLTIRNQEKEDGSENGRNLYSAEHILAVAGMPYFITKDFEEALNEADMILLSSSVKNKTFTTEELDTLIGWTETGGVLVAPACLVSGTSTSRLFGVTSSTYSKARFFATWDDELMNEKELEYMDDPEEKDFSLGNEKNAEAIKTYGYTLSSGECMAHFNTGEPAVVRNKLGEGCAYTFGVLWRDVIQRPQLNKDFSAQRAYSNGFEPSADAFPLFVRSVYAKYASVSVCKSTIPEGYSTVLIPTHDCDSQTAYDEMHYMSDYEKSLRLNGHYFLTTHYYRDPSYLSAFYSGKSIDASRQLIANKHTVGSHSIGHFPDFSKTERFPKEKHTRESYKADHDINTGITTGGSTWAEIALSKEILESDLKNQVKSFRSGHLTMNKLFPEVEEEAGYLYSSCYGAGDVMTCFPYWQRIGNEWTGRLSTVLEMPLHFSDVFNDDPISETNMKEKAEIWLKIMGKLSGNYAPSILLIHPNRKWKMEVQKILIESMDRSSYGLWNFENFGEFWKNRHNFQFRIGYVEDENKVIIRADRQDFDNNPHISFILDLKNELQLPQVILRDENSYSRPMRVKQLDLGKLIAY